MKKIIAMLITLSLTLCLLCSCSGGDGENNDSGSSSGSLGKYDVVIDSCRFASDYSNDPIIIVKYKFKNNSSFDYSFNSVIDTFAYQNGVELDTTVLVPSSADFSSTNQSKIVDAGGSLYVEVAYELLDTESDVRIDVKESLSFSDETVTKTIPITITNFNVTALEFLSVSPVQISVGSKTAKTWLRAEVNSNSDFSYQDVVFVSENPDVATIDFDSEALTVYLYYTITGVSKGTTYVYAQTKDGSVVSEKIKVTVN